ERIGAPRLRSRLRPQVARITRRTAELERNEVILLVRGQRTAFTVLTHLPELERLRVALGRSDLSRPPADANRGVDRRLSNHRVENARSQTPNRPHNAKVARVRGRHEHGHECRGRDRSTESCAQSDMSYSAGSTM